MFFKTKIIKILKHNIFNVALAVSLKISSLVKYLIFSLRVKIEDEDKSECSKTSLSKSDKILLMSDAVNHTEIPFNAT